MGMNRIGARTNTKASMFRVTKELTFCYGHRLLQYEGRCRHLHGHNGRVVITLAGSELDERGMLIDFGDIKTTIGAWIDQNLDHHTVLRHDDPLVGALREHGQPLLILDVNPTAENLAKRIFEEAKRLGFPVVEVEFWETASSRGVYAPLQGVISSLGQNGANHQTKLAT